MGGNKMNVGDNEPREVTQVNNELFLAAKEIIEEGQHLSHIGWSGVGDFIDWLELNYDIKKKGN